MKSCENIRESLEAWLDGELSQSEADAVRETVVFLLEVKRFQGNAQRPGHNVCGEAAALLRRYPSVPDPRMPGDRTCAEEFGGVKS